VPHYHTGGQSFVISGHHSPYPPLSAMKKPSQTALSPMHADEKPSPMHADDYPVLVACIVIDRQCSPHRSAPRSSIHAPKVLQVDRLERSIVQTVKE
jgi:hypothetical protein